MRMRSTNSSMRIGLCDDKRVSFSIVVFRWQQANYLYRGLHEHYDGQTWSASTTVNCSRHVFARAGWFCSEVLVWWTCICTISIWMRPQIVGKQNDLNALWLIHASYTIVSRSLTTFTVPTTNDVPFTEQAIYSAPNNIPWHTVHWAQIY